MPIHRLGAPFVGRLSTEKKVEEAKDRITDEFPVENEDSAEQAQSGPDRTILRSSKGGLNALPTGRVIHSALNCSAQPVGPKVSDGVRNQIGVGILLIGGVHIGVRVPDARSIPFIFHKSQPSSSTGVRLPA